MADEHISVVVKDDFVARQTRSRPVAALAELIWNGLDGDATRIDVEFDESDLAGGMSKIVVYDNGEGFPRSEAKSLFGNLGGSWKRLTRETSRHKRMIHGQEGRGRYKAFALGRAVDWDVCYQNGKNAKAFNIKLLNEDLTDVTISDEKDVQRPTGVTVTIDDLWRTYPQFKSDDGRQELAEIFALYLMNYGDVAISIAGEKLDPSVAIANQKVIELPPILSSDGTNHACELHIVEWRTESKRTLYLCSSNGFPLDQVDTRFHIFPSASFSAYLKSTYIEELNNKESLGLAEMDPVLSQAVEAARLAIKDYFRERAAEKARTVVDEWKAADIYPYRGEPQGTVEKAERQVFDIVAVQLHEIAPEIDSGSDKARALHLRMLRSAIERGPEELQMIFKEVLGLPPRKQQELAALLQETTLSAIITAAKTVADRLKFISALESIVFDPETKGRLKERSQLHKILAENTWIFGEEYNLWVSDKDLKRVLEKHKKHLDPGIKIDDPVKVIDKKRGIIDLMFSRATRRHRSNDVENMVVELKAPKVKIGSKETVQAKTYAMAVSADERFSTVAGVKWHFWVVSNDYDDFAKSEIEGGPDPERRLIWKNKNISVGVKTWGELIEENRARLQFFQEHLQHNADESAAIQYLQERHSKFLDGVVEPKGDGSDDGPSEE